MTDEITHLKARVAQLEAELQAERDERTIEQATGQQQLDDLAVQLRDAKAPRRVAQPNYARLGLGSADEAEGMN